MQLLISHGMIIEIKLFVLLQNNDYVCFIFKR